MSHLFSYEIDERNLRVQLKNLEIQQREEAWQRFESFANQHPIIAQRQAFQGIQFKVNRQVMMPVIFGGIILSFSFLLYNFVSIKKDPISESAASTAAPEPEAQAAIILAKESTPITAPVEQQKVEVQAPEPKLEVAAKPAPAVTEPAAKPVEKTDVVEQAVVAQSAEKQITATPEATVSKKQRRRAEEAALKALKPTVVSEDEEAGEIPQ